MAFGSKNKGPSEGTLVAQAQAANTTAGTVDPLQEAKRKRDAAFEAWRSGENGPVDVYKMPGADVGIDLFKKAKESSDAGRIGRGLGSLADGANPNFNLALGQENQLERDLAAKGAFENYVSGQLAQHDDAVQQDYTNRENHNFSYAGLTQNALTQYRQTRTPSFLKQLALAGTQTAGTLGGAAITAGMI